MGAEKGILARHQTQITDRIHQRLPLADPNAIMALTESTNRNFNPHNDRHPTMTLLSGPLCVFSHCCRIVLMEKDVEHRIEYRSVGDDPSRLGELNPYGEVPTLLDRDLALYDTSVIIEYLDERFPHPPLMPVDPITRAKTRLMISRLTRDWLQSINELGETTKPKPPVELKKIIRDGLLSLSPLFDRQSFFLSDEYTLADAYIAPLLWRLPMLGINLPKQADPIVIYSERIFKRLAFIGSLSPEEAELR